MQRVFGGLFGLMLTLAIGLAAVPAQAVTIGVLPVGGSYSDTISSGGPTFSRDYNFSLAGGANNVSILATAFGQSSSDFGVDLLKIALYDSASNLIASGSGTPIAWFDSFSQSGIALGAGAYLFTVFGQVTAGKDAFVSISLADLDTFFATGAWPDERPGFIPVFYEGYRNSAEVAGPVCDELGITGWFPVCTGFVDCPPDEQEAYARSHFIGLVAVLLYEPILTWKYGATLGKRALGLRVAVLDNGQSPSAGRAFGRWVSAIAMGFVPFLGLINVLWCLWDTPYRQCLHDKAAGTVVVNAR